MACSSYSLPPPSDGTHRKPPRLRGSRGTRWYPEHVAPSCQRPAHYSAQAHAREKELSLVSLAATANPLPDSIGAIGTCCHVRGRAAHSISIQLSSAAESRVADYLWLSKSTSPRSGLIGTHPHERQHLPKVHPTKQHISRLSPTPIGSCIIVFHRGN